MQVDVKHSAEISIAELNDPAWESSPAIHLTKYWNGELAPPGRHSEVQMLWSDTSLFVRFTAAQTEPLIVSNAPQTVAKTIGLWERDVCELFVAPDRLEPHLYFEFEAAPTGEWIDLAINSTSGERITDWDYRSEMETAATIEEDRVVLAMKIPFRAFGRKPEAGDVWLGNIFRCVGSGPDRGYLAWRPTYSEKPNFHVPEKFGHLTFAR